MSKANYKTVIGRIVEQKDGKSTVWQEKVGKDQKKVTKFAIRTLKNSNVYVTVTLWEESRDKHTKYLEEGALVIADGSYNANKSKTGTVYHNLSVTKAADLWTSRTEASIMAAVALQGITDEEDDTVDLPDIMVEPKEEEADIFGL